VLQHFQQAFAIDQLGKIFVSANFETLFEPRYAGKNAVCNRGKRSPNRYQRESVDPSGFELRSKNGSVHVSPPRQTLASGARVRTHGVRFSSFAPAARRFPRRGA
jgi:hypothetical protein